jgi:hypothetical protein
MYNCDTEVIFPARIIPDMEDVRGDAWQELVAQVNRTSHLNEDRAAFVLTMARLCGCASCQADSFQALRGCSLCAQRTLRRYAGNDDSLVERYRLAKVEVHKFIESMQY